MLIKYPSAEDQTNVYELPVRTLLGLTQQNADGVFSVGLDSYAISWQTTTPSTTNGLKGTLSYTDGGAKALDIEIKPVYGGLDGYVLDFNQIKYFTNIRPVEPVTVDATTGIGKSTLFFADAVILLADGKKIYHKVTIQLTGSALPSVPVCTICNGIKQ